jgi:hypothetical protein
MHMMYMLAILGFVFTAALFLMCFFREKLKNPIVNPLLLIAYAAFFFCWNYAAYELRWLEDGFMTLENISPFICTVILCTPFLNKTVRDYAYCAIAFLSFGMFLAMFVSPGAEFLMNYQQNVRFIHVSEGACHLIMALYGYYLVLTDKVKVNFKTFGKAIAFIYASVGFGVFLNWCFHLSNFGMDMYGNYSIYFLDIFGSFEATFVAYLFGILATVTLGFLSAELIDWLSKEKKAVPTASSDGEQPLEKTERAEKVLADPDAEANA